MTARARNAGTITRERSRALALRGAAVRRARRDRRLADRLEARAGELLTRAAELRRRVLEDLAASGVADGA